MEEFYAHASGPRQRGLGLRRQRSPVLRHAQPTAPTRRHAAGQTRIRRTRQPRRANPHHRRTNTQGHFRPRLFQRHQAVPARLGPQPRRQHLLVRPRRQFCRAQGPGTRRPGHLLTTRAQFGRRRAHTDHYPRAGRRGRDRLLQIRHHAQPFRQQDPGFPVGRLRPHYLSPRPRRRRRQDLPRHATLRLVGKPHAAGALPLPGAEFPRSRRPTLPLGDGPDQRARRQRRAAALLLAQLYRKSEQLAGPGRAGRRRLRRTRYPHQDPRRRSRVRRRERTVRRALYADQRRLRPLRQPARPIDGGP